MNEVASLKSSNVEAETEDADNTADLVSQQKTNNFSTSDDHLGRSTDDDAGEHAEDDAEDDANNVRNSGVRLIGRSVRKLYATPSEPEGYKLYTGTVFGSRVDNTWGTVYGVRYEDGEEQEVIYEEVIPMLDEPDVKQSAVPLSVVEASFKARSSWAVEKYFPRRGKAKGKKRTWVGVKRDAEFEDAFYGVATDPRKNVEHRFDMMFSTRHAAGAAHDLLVRRMRAVAAKDKNFIVRKDVARFDAGRGPRAKRGDDALDFEALNFQDTSWSDLCGIILGGVATKLTRVVRANAPPMKRPSLAPPLPPPATKKKKRDPKAPYHENVGSRVYDSQLGVTFHWCLQKTHEAPTTPTAPRTPTVPRTPTLPRIPSTPSNATMPLVAVVQSGRVVPAAAAASAAVADMRRALGDAKAMVAEGLLEVEDYEKIKERVLVGIAFGAGRGASLAGA